MCMYNWCHRLNRWAMHVFPFSFSSSLTPLPLHKPFSLSALHVASSCKALHNSTAFWPSLAFLWSPRPPNSFLIYPCPVYNRLLLLCILSCSSLFLYMVLSSLLIPWNLFSSLFPLASPCIPLHFAEAAIAAELPESLSLPWGFPYHLSNLPTSCWPTELCLGLSCSLSPSLPIVQHWVWVFLLLCVMGFA